MMVEMSKYLKKTVLYLKIIVSSAAILIFISFLLYLKHNIINNKFDKMLQNTKWIINENLIQNNQTSKDMENDLNYYEGIDEYNIGSIINNMQRQNKISEAYFLMAYKNILDNDEGLALENLIKSLENMKKSSSILSKIYAGTLLSNIYMSNGDVFNASEVVRYSLSNISRKEYNDYYNEIWMLMDTIAYTDDGSNKVISFCEEILEQYNDLRSKTKLYFTIKLKELYMMKYNYAKASEYLIRGCYIAYDMGDHYSLAMCITDLGKISGEIENKDKAIEFIDKGLKIIIEDKKNKNRFVLKILFLSIGFSTTVFLVFYIKIRRLRMQNVRDGLTKCYNRIYFNELYNNFMRKKLSFGIIMIDIDNFKKLNDTYGHQFGDIVLTRICSDVSEIIDNDMKLCRYGGEEFVIAVSNKDKEDIINMAEKIRKCIEIMKWSEDKVTVTLSIGIAVSDEYMEDTLRKADQNLYIAKTTGKNKVVWN